MCSHLQQLKNVLVRVEARASVSQQPSRYPSRKKLISKLANMRASLVRSEGEATSRGKIWQAPGRGANCQDLPKSNFLYRARLAQRDRHARDRHARDRHSERTAARLLLKRHQPLKVPVFLRGFVPRQQPAKQRHQHNPARPNVHKPTLLRQGVAMVADMDLVVRLLRNE